MKSLHFFVNLEPVSHTDTNILIAVM